MTSSATIFPATNEISFNITKQQYCRLQTGSDALGGPDEVLTPLWWAQH